MLDTVHAAIFLFVQALASASVAQLLTSKNSDWQASFFESSVMAAHSASFLTMGCPFFCSTVPAASTSVTSLTARPSSAAVWIITTRLLIVPVRSASGTTVSDGTYV